ncbi:hypothetical protein [Streptomyces sp. NPDC048527]
MSRTADENARQIQPDNGPAEIAPRHISPAGLATLVANSAR